MSTRRRARLARALSRFAVIAEAGRLAVAVPALSCSNIRLVV